MWPTMEVRWFGAGSVGAGVREWLEAGERRPETRAGRVDHYLRLHGTDSLGIKLREGKVEVKQLHQRHGVVRFHGRVTGVMEHWRKWSFLVAQPGSLADALSPASVWVAVQKERHLLKYQVGDGQTLVAMPTDHYPQRGCYVELAKVVAEGADWWSLALEAFGSESTLRQTLLLVAQHVFARGSPPALEAEDSHSYPTWLHRLLGPQA